MSRTCSSSSSSAKSPTARLSFGRTARPPPPLPATPSFFLKTAKTSWVRISPLFLSRRRRRPPDPLLLAPDPPISLRPAGGLSPASSFLSSSPRSISSTSSPCTCCRPRASPASPPTSSTSRTSSPTSAPTPSAPPSPRARAPAARPSGASSSESSSPTSRVSWYRRRGLTNRPRWPSRRR